MKKGQLEIVGFMVIVLLLLMGLIFYFRFANTGSTDLLKEAEENLEVSNLLSSIRLYTVCEGTQMNDIIKTCISGGSECGEDACDVLKEEIPTIVAYNGWANDSYMFYIGEDLYSPSTCKGNTFVDDYLSEGETVRLVYCYS